MYIMHGNSKGSLEFNGRRSHGTGSMDGSVLSNHRTHFKLRCVSMQHESFLVLVLVLVLLAEIDKVKFPYQTK